ncbi:neprosin family prolyl endopeptidase [Actinoplanes sp. G11-F43]|uniref:neprosin family prolyl endopeptidase n=1 Tax=Actinoplanes sp. G11-F43 TaxID=3424130 RepID=UPI003D33EFD1
MLKSRRGLLAAGIIAAVVGSIGVASTLNAGAEQIPAPAEAPAADPASGLTPPATLPWGDAPEDLDTGRDGASSRSLKAAGLDAAAPDTSGEEAGEAFAPKGATNGRSFRRSERTTVVPPVPPSTGPSASASASAPADDKPAVHFHYNVGAQAAVTEGAYANMTISRPVLDKEDYHSLAEIAVQNGDGTQVVEVGWNVDRVVNGDDDPHLFVFHWVDGKPTCYNGCGFVQYSANIRPGDTLPQDTVKKFGIQYISGAWWIAYDTEWVGYYPDKLWSTSGFTKSGNVQIFGEVAAASLKPCTQMGNGRTPDDTTAARVSSVTYLNGPTVDMAVRSTSDVYPVSKLSTRTFRYGGPGAC